MPLASSVTSTSSSVLTTLDTLLSLPDDARQQAVEHIFLPLLDKVSKEDSKRAIIGLSELKNRYLKCPDLDLRQRKAEIGGLLDALDVDYKRKAVIRGRSIRHDLLDEALETLGAWLNDVWIITSEFEIRFDLAHLCLLEIGSLVDEVFSDAHGSCKCGFDRDTFVPLHLRDHTGRLVKRFNRFGPDNIKQATLWVWRDLFLSMLASGNQQAIARLPLMFADITDARGIPALERILYGGDIYAKKEYDEDDPDDIEADNSSGIDDGDPRMDGGGSDSRSNAHAAHWSPRFKQQVQQLHKHISTHLLTVFALSPSAPLYYILDRLYQDLDTPFDKATPLRTLDALVPLTPSMLISTLTIYIQLDKPQQIDRLLSSYAQLLRPRDHTTLAFATLNMARTPATLPCAIALLTRELLDVARTLPAMLRRFFPFIDAPIYMAHLREIMDLLEGSWTRQEKVHALVNSVALVPASIVLGAAVGAPLANFPHPPGPANLGPPTPISAPVNFINGVADNPFWNLNTPPNIPPIGVAQAPLPPHPDPAPAAAGPLAPLPSPHETAVAALNVIVHANTANAANVNVGALAGPGIAPVGGTNPANIAVAAGGGAGGWPFVAAPAQYEDMEDQYGPNPGIFITPQRGQAQTWGGWSGPHGMYSFGPLDFSSGSRRFGPVDENGVPTSWAERDSERWGSLKDGRECMWKEELADLKEEFRPRMKERWDAWMRVAVSVEGAGDALREKVYVKVLEIMPFLDATDVVDEMFIRLSERQSKHYIRDALASVSMFCNTQKAAIAAARGPRS